MTTTSTKTKIPFSYEERLLLTTSGSASGSTSTSTSANVKTVRLESLAKWNDRSWIHPFSDIDIDLISHSNGIEQVHMSTASHPTKKFPSSLSSSSSSSYFGLDGVPVLPLGDGDDIKNDKRYLTAPQGFFLSIKPVDGLTPEEEAVSVQAVFEELLRQRLITAPVTGAKWDVIPSLSLSSSSSSRNLYQIILPFSGAALSSDALEQSFQTTLPAVCDSTGGGDNSHKKFFGWTALEWSNFLVGYGNVSGNFNNNNNNNNQYPTYNKLMWWTWTSSSSSSSSSQTKSDEKSLSFGIQYQTFVPSSNYDDSISTKNWLPNVFLEESLSCSIGERNAFRVNVLPLPHESKTTASGYRLEPLQITNNDNGSTNDDEKSLLLSSLPTFAYEVSVDQVLRRHHTNQGRFESVISLRPLFDSQNSYFLSLSCHMKYRQVLPDFLSPMWRSLKVVDTAITNNDDSTPYYTSSEQVQASVEWKSDDQSSLLYVEAISGPQSSQQLKQDNEELNKTFMFLPSTLAISFEYGPSFLTLDDFPGDPNRGRELPPARITVQCNPPPPHHHHTTTETTASTIRSPDSVIVYSNSLILLPPVPDMSMPFNVISLTSSLYAYIAGAIVTILVRKASEKIKYKLYPEKKPISKIRKIKDKLKEKVNRFKTKFIRSKAICDDTTEIVDKNNTESMKTTPTTNALESIDIGNQSNNETTAGNTTSS